MTDYFIRDDFAGPGGWSEAIRLLGLPAEAGIEFDAAAVQTAIAAGHKRWMIDVTNPAVRDYRWPRMWGYIASPPCQTFSLSGNGEGRKHFESLMVAMRLVAHEGHPPERAVRLVSDEALDERSVLVLEPMLVIRDHRPTWVALEQVPPVLPIWEAYAEILRDWGYHVVTGLVHSEQYGVGQARTRAVLMAHLEREVHLPTPTHSRYHRNAPGRLDDGVAKWLTAAEALGEDWAPVAANEGTTAQDMAWVYERPAPTVVASFRGDVLAKPAYRRKGDGPRQKAKGSVVVTAAEAGVLQSFPRDYPWQGPLTKQHEQIGNAIPPLLARVILEELTHP